MSSIYLNYYIDKVIEVALFGLRWWGRELRDVMSAPILARLFPERPFFLIELGEEVASLYSLQKSAREHLVTAPLSELAKLTSHDALQHRCRLTISIAPRAILQRRLELPIATERNLETALRLQLGRLVPFNIDDILFDFHVKARDHKAGKIVVQLAVVESHCVEPIIAHVKESGVTPEYVGTPCENDVKTPYFNFTRTQRPRMKEFLRRPLSLALMICLVAGIAATMAISDHRDRELSAYQQKISTLTKDVRAVRQLRSELAEQSAWVSNILEQKSSLSIVAALDKLSQMLPDDTWLYELRFSDLEWRASGYSANATKLLIQLENDPAFHNVRFAAPITRDDTADLDRFELLFAVSASLEE